MVLAARKGLRSGGLGRIPAECDLGLPRTGGHNRKGRRKKTYCACFKCASMVEVDRG
jgi:hypothetical protein